MQRISPENYFGRKCKVHGPYYSVLDNAISVRHTLQKMRACPAHCSKMAQFGMLVLRDGAIDELELLSKDDGIQIRQKWWLLQQAINL